MTTVDTTTDRTAGFNGRYALATLGRPFVAVWNFLVMLGEYNSRVVALRELTDTPESVLAARGTNRADEIRRILGPSVWA